MEMTTEVIYDKNFLIILYRPELKLVHLKWKGFTTSEQFKEGLNAALKIVQDQKIENWLGDLKLMELILPADEDWATSEWFPLLKTTTLRKMAIITSLDYLNNSSVKRIVNVVSPDVHFQIRYFIDVIDALAWIEEEF